MLSRWRHSAVIAALLILALLSGALPALAVDAGLAGHWEGAIEIPGTKLGIDVDFKPGDGGAWTGTISIPLQNAKDLPLTGIKVDGASVTFEIQGVPVRSRLSPMPSAGWWTATAAIPGWSTAATSTASRPW
jgi:hypothetical protein